MSSFDSQVSHWNDVVLSEDDILVLAGVGITVLEVDDFHTLAFRINVDFRKLEVVDQGDDEERSDRGNRCNRQCSASYLLRTDHVVSHDGMTLKVNMDHFNIAHLKSKPFCCLLLRFCCNLAFATKLFCQHRVNRRLWLPVVRSLLNLTALVIDGIAIRAELGEVAVHDDSKNFVER